MNPVMGGMNPMGGGPVGGGMPMMANGGGIRPPVQVDAAGQRAQLNTYIYEYFLKHSMWDCARALINSDQPVNVHHKGSPGQNGEDGGEGDSKNDDPKKPDDLPSPNLPGDVQDSCFLYEWWALFWDIFNAQRNKGERPSVVAYVNHNQAQSRQRQEQQAQSLRIIRANDGMTPNYQQMMMMRNQPNGGMQQLELQKRAMQNRQQNGTNPQQAQMLAQQQKANQMQRDPSDGNNQNRPHSPGSAENAPSPSKKPRLEGAAFNPQQGMPNGRGQMQGMPQQVGDTGPSNAIQAAHMQLANGIEPNNLTGQQFQVPGGANPAQQARSLAGYQAGLAQQQAGQMPAKQPMPPGGPPNQGSPMMAQGPADGNLANYYNPTDMGANGMRGPAGGQGAGTGNHALQDYQMQLMLLEQQNKKRLMMARQEQDSMTLPRGPDGGPGPQGMGPNGQPFQGASPGARNSPNPTDAIKRTPHMNPGSIPSPIPDGQNRGSPGAMNFGNMQGNPMDPNMNPKFYQMNGMDPNMVAAGIPNGMRPPSSHPGAFNNNPLAQQQQLQMQQRQQAVQQQQAQQQANGQNWTGPNGQMVGQPNQGTPQQQIGTPRQQNQMPPPSAPAGGAVVNGRTQPSSPQQGTAAPPTPNQGNKANPKKKPDAKDTKAKRAAKKGSAANLNSGATPSADAPTDGPTPTPQTPITPSHKFAGQNGAVQPPTNGQPIAPPANPGVVIPQQPDPMNNFGGMNDYSYDNNQLGFADPNNGNMDVLQDFDFDSFLHQDNDVGDNFTFDAFPMDDGGQIGAD